MGAEDGWEDSVDWSQGPPSLLCDGEARYRYDDVGAAGGGVLLCASACVRASVCVCVQAQLTLSGDEHQEAEVRAREVIRQ